ncbi:T6SS immunity protein Tdi1 domain-containing protein [Dyella mobilis]|uniref:DUF1851 domain-containing protein n=1 Tax=Dyella mobilis TaxID=1849582 RepID=A0ABS2KJL0_9GAMM|nr:T6SS immunity protein Tdi1 domain-containing protein [Dyella mobilis]MBM7131264.1 DUF1851 domain-containing protein [Dyella mobilis]GLQ98799.1 hypothetical protein GCM10007863_32190 [Dyella mobilis]
MFELFEPVRFDHKAPRWAKRVPKYPLIFGHSAFGHLFVCSEAQSNLAVIATERPEFIELKLDSVQAFKDDFLKNEGVLNDFFGVARYEQLVKRIGELSEAECYFPVPYPASGGSGAKDSYQKGNIWVHLDLYGQVIGL